MTRTSQRNVVRSPDAALPWTVLGSAIAIPVRVLETICQRTTGGGQLVGRIADKIFWPPRCFITTASSILPDSRILVVSALAAGGG